MQAAKAYTLDPLAVSMIEVRPMKRWIRAICAIVFCTASFADARTAFAGSAAATPPATTVAAPGIIAQIDLVGPIGPATAEYFDHATRHAEIDGAAAIVLRLDTPGGLADSMRQIITRILSSKIPVLGYVGPDGARAASAGTYILYASHVAAMAPATHLGAATPVSLGGPMPTPAESPSGLPEKKDAPGTEAKPADSEAAKGNAGERKALNDSIAYIRTLAQLRGRNAEWAEAAVRDAATLTASEALQQHVIEIIAADVPALLAQANGRQVKINGEQQTLQLAGASIRAYAPNWRSRFLGIITNPTFAYLLLLAGIYGIFLEAWNPGAFVPGVVGGICLLIGLYALQLLPVNYAGLALMALGIGLLVAEALSPSIGIFGIGGLIAFVFGSILLFDNDVPGYEVNLGVIAGIAAGAVALLALTVGLVLRSRRAPRFSGDELLREARGEMIGALAAGEEGWARVIGERWRVRSDLAIAAGAPVRVIKREGIILWVKPE